MPVIVFQKLSEYLQAAGESLPASWLIHGEEFLCAKALEEVLSVLLPQPSDRLNYEPLGQSNSQVVLGLEKVNTYSFLTGPKVVALLDCQVFDTPQNTEAIAAKVKAALDEDDIKKAARHFTRLLGALNLSLDQVAEKKQPLLKLDPEANDQWIDTMVTYCRDNGMTVSSGTNQSQMLVDAVDNGFPEAHYLMITVDVIDRRRRLYKEIAEKGVVVDCSVPQGSRQADKTVQEAVLKERMAPILKKHDKQMDVAAFRALYEKTGFQLRVFCGNLEKLIDFVGSRQQIFATDVETVLSRSKEDPVFELTSAISERNLETAWQCHKALLKQELHPLQVIAALVNQIRKLIIAREFVESPHGRAWRAGMGFPDFQRTVVPAIRLYDDELRQMRAKWEDRLGTQSGPESGGDPPQKKGKKKKGSQDTRLFLFGGAGSAYPVYKLVENVQRFTLQELTDLLESCFEADWRLKGGEKSPEIVLGRLILRICQS